MAAAGEELRGADGFRLLLVKTGAETDGELLEMEATYSGTGNMPPEHIHPSQTENFEVLEGEIRTIVDGDERVYSVGEEFEVPPGTPHKMGAEVPTRIRWQTRPALRTAEFFETLYDAIDREAGEELPQIFEEYSSEVQLTGN